MSIHDAPKRKKLQFDIDNLKLNIFEYEEELKGLQEDLVGVKDDMFFFFFMDIFLSLFGCFF
jgi:hypothetical protein